MQACEQPIPKLVDVYAPDGITWPELRAAAVQYQALGLAVVPVYREKKPVVAFSKVTVDNCIATLDGLTKRYHGTYKRYLELFNKPEPLRTVEETAELTKKIEDLGKYPITGIALRTGPVTGAKCPVLVVDLDLCQTNGDGREQWRNLCADWDVTDAQLKSWRTESGSGGQHLYFAWEDRFGVLKQSAKIAGTAIDTRMTNGLIIVAPSPWYDKHQGYAYTGHHYRWVAAPGDVPLARLPEPAFQWLLNNTGKGSSAKGAPKKGPKGKKKAKKTPDRDASPKRTKPANGGRWGREIVELVLPLVRQNGEQELPFRFNKWSSNSRLEFARTGPDPEPCQMCLPIRTTLKPDGEVHAHTSQNRYARLGQEARLGDEYYCQLYVGCYAETAAERLAGYLVSNDIHKPTHVATELPCLEQQLPPCLAEVGHAFPSLSPAQVPLLGQLLGFLDGRHVGDAELFRSLYGHLLLFDQPRGSWYCFLGHIWQPFSEAGVFELIKRLRYVYALGALLCVDDSQSGALLKRSGEFANAMTLGRTLKLVERLQSVTKVAWNEKRALIPFQNGVLDMRSGQLRDGQPEDYFNMAAPIAWTGIDTPCPVFERAYLQCFGDKAEVLAFVQRLLGYTMSGLGNEDLLAFLTGEQGASGKSTLLELLQKVFGPEMVRAIPAEVLMSSKRSQGGAAQPHLADLEGVRFAAVEEGNESRELNVTQAKWLSGVKGTMRVRQLFEPYRNVAALFTLFCLQNEFPECPAHAAALWRRIVNINMPYQHVEQRKLTDPKRQRLLDPTLMDKLEGELSGVAAWVVRGFLSYREGGLAAPAAVLQSTEDSRTSVDPLHEWIKARCELSANAFTLTDTLLESYQMYSGDKTLSKRFFAKALEQRKLEREHDKATRKQGFKGIKLVPIAKPPQQDFPFNASAEVVQPAPESPAVQPDIASFFAAAASI